VINDYWSGKPEESAIDNWFRTGKIRKRDPRLEQLLSVVHAKLRVAEKRKMGKSSMASWFPPYMEVKRGF